MNLKPGDKVCYIPFDGCSKDLYENGIVKSVQGSIAFVAYHCNNDWDNYMDYTGAATYLNNLKLGWKS
jgi:hypothetical protein